MRRIPERAAASISGTGRKREIYFIGNRTGFTSIYKIDLRKREDPELVIGGESSDE